MKRNRKRTHEIKIRLSDHELEELVAKVRKTGLSREAFCRQVLRGNVVKEAPSADVLLLLREVRQLSILFERLVKLGEARALEPTELSQRMDQLEAVEQLIVEAYR